MYTTIFMISNRSTGIHCENTPGAHLASLFTYVCGLYEHPPDIADKTRASGASCRCTAHGIRVGNEAGPSQIVELQNPGALIYHVISTRKGANTRMYQQIQHVKITLT